MVQMLVILSKMISTMKKMALKVTTEPGERVSKAAVKKEKSLTTNSLSQDEKKHLQTNDQGHLNEIFANENKNNNNNNNNNNNSNNIIIIIITIILIILIGWCSVCTSLLLLSIFLSLLLLL